MSLAIYKYPLKIVDTQALQLPHGSRLLTVQCQYDTQLCLWALVPLDGDVHGTEDWEITIIGTGNNAPVLQGPHPPRYLCTVQMEQGRLVWHIFIRTSLEAALALKVHNRLLAERPKP